MCPYDKDEHFQLNKQGHNSNIMKCESGLCITVKTLYKNLKTFDKGHWNNNKIMAICQFNHKWNKNQNQTLPTNFGKDIV